MSDRLIIHRLEYDPSGKTVVYSVRRPLMNGQKNRRRTDLGLINYFPAKDKAFYCPITTVTLSKFALTYEELKQITNELELIQIKEKDNICPHGS